MGRIERKFTVDAGNNVKHKFICKECGRGTNHLILATCQEDGSEFIGNDSDLSVDWTRVNQIIQCQGCETVSFRVESRNSEDVDHDESGNFYQIETVKFYPARVDGLKARNLYLLPLVVQGIYQETISAIENEQQILAGIGIRALVETICKDLSAGGKNLYEKISSLEKRSIVTKEGAEILHKLRVLGNKAAHEVAKHDQAQLSLAIQIIEHMLEGTYIIPHKVSSTFKNN